MDNQTAAMADAEASEVDETVRVPAGRLAQLERTEQELRNLTARLGGQTVEGLLGRLAEMALRLPTGDDAPCRGRRRR